MTKQSEVDAQQGVNMNQILATSDPASTLATEAEAALARNFTRHPPTTNKLVSALTME